MCAWIEDLWLVVQRAVTVPYIVETADGDSDLSYEELLQLSSAAPTGVITSQGLLHWALSTCCPLTAWYELSHEHYCTWLLVADRPTIPVLGITPFTRPEVVERAVFYCCVVVVSHHYYRNSSTTVLQGLGPRGFICWPMWKRGLNWNARKDAGRRTYCIKEWLVDSEFECQTRCILNRGYTWNKIILK